MSRETMKGGLLLAAVVLSASIPDSSNAQSVDIGGATCTQNYAWYDYYTNGELTDSQYEADGVTCFPSAGGGYEGGEGNPGGGGSGSTSVDLVDRAISAKLKCALDNYLHSNVKLGASRTMKRVNAYGFGKESPTGWYYQFRATNTSPGSGWKPVAGIAAPGTSYGRLYRGAFEGRSNFQRTGTRPGASQNSLSGSISSFEMSLFVGGHEASHLRGNLDESVADWYGIQAVRNYRNDGGAKCGS